MSVGEAANGDPPVLSRAVEDTVGRGAGVAVALTRLLPTIHRIIEQHRRGEVERGLQLRHVDVDALSGAPAAVQTGQNGGHGEPRDDEIGVGAIGIDRVPVGPAGQVGEAHQRRQHRSEARLFFHRSTPAHHGGAEHHNPGVDFF